ncbi:MAG: 30S ribosomal protein S8 [Candidatus Paceibacterota bacterium]
MYIDLITKIKNAEAVEKRYIKTPYSKMDKAVAKILERKGFLKKVEVKGRSPKKILKIYPNYKKTIQGVQFLSKPSLKKYKGYNDFKPVKSNYGIMIVSTPKGILSGGEAKKEKVGGQLLFKIW